jgi:hypothetical protein
VKHNRRRRHFRVGTHTAAELEAAVLDQLQHIIRAPSLASNIAERAKAHDNDIDEAKVTVALTQFAQVWEQVFPAEQSRIVNFLVERASRYQPRNSTFACGQMESIN